MPRILLDLTPLVTSATRRGIGRYVRGLVQGLEAIGREHWQDLELCGMAASDTVDRILSPITDIGAYAGREPVVPVEHADIKRSSLVTLRMVRAARAANADLLHLTEPRGIPLSRHPVVTVTSHDLIVLSQHQQYLPPIPGWPILYRGLEHLRYQSAKRILAISEATKRDLMNLLGFDAARIDVVYHGIDHQRFHPQAAEGERERVAALVGSTAPYIVYVGAGDPRKDLDTLVRAHALVARQGVRLVFAGVLPPARRDALERLASQLGSRDAVHFAGFVAEDLVAALYRQARVHVFASRYEGFGLPILEAMACGTPTITSPGSALDEVAGDAAEIVTCGDPEALGAALERTLSDEGLRTAMQQRGRARAGQFTWERSATATLEFWRRVLSD